MRLEECHDTLRLADNGVAVGAILLPDRCSPFVGWVASEVERYVGLISGAELPTVGSGADGGPWIVLGGPGESPVVAAVEQAGLVDFAGLREDGYVLKTVALNGRPTIIAGGNSDAATMYAAYDLIERMGVAFHLTGDVVPERKPTLDLSPLDVRAEPTVKYRGLHMRHFVMPWMGMDEFRDMVDQLAKTRCNYLEFYVYTGSPWVDYRYRGERKLVGDLYDPAWGFTSWRCETYGFGPDDVEIGRRHFGDGPPIAREFRHCRSQDEAYEVARELLNRMISYAHERRVRIWLGKGDCPGVSPNLGRLAGYREPSSLFGPIIPAGDPAGAEIWTAALSSMAESYPEADGHWLWLAEGYYHSDDSATKTAIARYDHLRKLIPPLAKLRDMGYDQYFRRMSETEQIESDLGLIYYADVLVRNMKRLHPDVRVGVSLLGRSYLFPALDALLPDDVPLQSMESCVVWNRASRVPMENFAAAPNRETFLVPRLDDDCSELAMQFNVGIYDRDRVVAGAAEFGVAGVAPQTGRTRGAEHNARFVADGAWDSTLTPERFYRGYVVRTFGRQSAEKMFEAYDLLERTEHYLGLGVDSSKVGSTFQGMTNFVNYADSTDIWWLREFRGQANSLGGPDFNDWNVDDDGESGRLARMRYRDERFGSGIEMLQEALTKLQESRPMVAAGAASELEYVICKTESYILHLQTIRELTAGHLAYDEAFRARKCGADDVAAIFGRCESRFARATELAALTAEKIASGIDHPTDAHILFRYNVRVLLPTREFAKFVGNVASFHRGEPYWAEVDWDVIDPPTCIR